MQLAPVQTLFGAMEWTCIGKAATQRTAADYWKTITAAAFADTSFDETTIKTAIYNAAYGSSPYDSIGSIGGFEINIDLDIVQIPAVDVGGRQLDCIWRKRFNTGMAFLQPRQG